MPLQASLQNFAWTDEHRARVHAERAAQCCSEAQREAVRAEPVFCFETAYKALYWSVLAYRIQARRPNTGSCNVCELFAADDDCLHTDLYAVHGAHKGPAAALCWIRPVSPKITAERMRRFLSQRLQDTAVTVAELATDQADRAAEARFCVPDCCNVI